MNALRASIIVLTALFHFNKLHAVEIVVCPSCDHQSISAAIETASDGDEILVKEGTYLEFGLEVHKRISIIGIGEVVIDGQEQGTIFSFHADGFKLEGLTIKNVGHSFTKDYAAVLIHRCEYFEVKDLILENVFFGILIEKSHNGVVSGNTISSQAEKEGNSGNGIHIWHSSGMMVTENEVFKLRDGIYFEFVTNSFISHNVSHDNIRYGLHFMFSNNDDYEDNTFSSNGAGVAVMFSKFINMRNNVFKDNWGAASYGLLLKEIYDAEIEGNTFLRNTTAINVEGSTRINYTLNSLNSNGWAIKITGACYDNIFEANDFNNNSFDLSYNGQLNNNRFEGNYWSSYAGYDLDKDGIGDVPFRPVKLFSYVVNRTPESIVLLRSLFVDLIDFSERVSPVFTPDKLIDDRPLMKPNR